jgi:hypothetical protein
MYVMVNGYAASSTYNVAITPKATSPSTYPFNALAAKLYHVKLAVDYITESDPAVVDGNLSASINTYTRTDSYEYILEVDAAGKVNGGEWIGSSKRNHPDFVWLPLSVGATSVAGGKITYTNVMQLLDESLTTSVVKTGTIAKAAWTQLGSYNLAAGKTLTATMTGTGDADLYVRKGAAPTAAAWDCRPYAGTSAETCQITGPALVYVAVNGYATTSTYSVTINYTPAN